MILLIQFPPDDFNIEIHPACFHRRFDNLRIFHAVEGITRGRLIVQFLPLGGDLAMEGAGKTLLGLLCYLEFLPYYRLERSHVDGCLHKIILLYTADSGFE
jgi:hypothetical protein